MLHSWSSPGHRPNETGDDFIVVKLAMNWALTLTGEVTNKEWHTWARNPGVKGDLLVGVTGIPVDGMTLKEKMPVLSRQPGRWSSDSTTQGMGVVT